MKKLLLLFFIVTLIFSCSTKTEKKHELTKAEKEEEQFKHADIQLRGQKEKIVLLATIKSIPYDSLYSILKDYYFNLDGDTNNDTTIRNSLTYTTEKHSFPKSKIASFVFSFKFEMLTREEIFQNEVDAYADEEVQQDYETPEDNYR